MAGRSIEITMPQDRFATLMDALRGIQPKVIEAIKSATFIVESIAKKDFMSVQDGSLVRIIKKGKTAGTRVMTKRTKFPGVRASTGNLRRNTRSVFRYSTSGFEGAVGTNVPYGKILDQNPNYEFLGPALEKARPEIERLVSDAIRGALVG